jgi:hypothetical protein
MKKEGGKKREDGKRKVREEVGDQTLKLREIFQIIIFKPNVNNSD